MPLRSKVGHNVRDGSPHLQGWWVGGGLKVTMVEARVWSTPLSSLAEASFQHCADYSSFVTVVLQLWLEVSREPESEAAKISEDGEELSLFACRWRGHGNVTREYYFLLYSPV